MWAGSLKRTNESFLLCMGKHLHPRRPLGTPAFIVLLSVLCASPKPAAQSSQSGIKQADSVHGIVVNSVTHEPIGRALVYSPDNHFATMTDGDGRFEFNFAPAEVDKNQGDTPESANLSGASRRTPCTDGSCSTSSNSYQPNQLMARKPGFLNDQNGIENLQSDTPGAGKEITIPLTPEALVVGRVALPSSEASDTIQLELYRRQVQDGRAHWIPAGSTSSRSNGEFRFAELAAGSYKLLTRELMDRDPLTFDPHGQLYGYPPIYFPNATDFAAGQTIQLAAGQIFQANISVVRRAYYPLKVAVVHVPTDSGINVVVSAQGHRGPGYALGYNHEDQMIVGSLPNGNYTLEAMSFRTNAASGLLNISVNGAAVEGPRMIMVPNGSISVNVKEEFTSSEDTSSQSVFNINGGRGNAQGARRYLNLRLVPADDFGRNRDAGLRPPSGPEDDSLAIDGVQPGRYWVRANSSRGFVASITSGTTDLQHQPLVVGVGGSSAPIEITMRDGSAEVDGTIQVAAASFGGTGGTTAAPNGAAPVSHETSTHVYFVPLPDSSGEFRDVWVSPDGKFSPQQFAPGTYRVLAFDHPQETLEYRNPEAMRAYDAKGQLLRLVAGQKEHLQLQLISSSE
jgi:hypothetical protein